MRTLDEAREILATSFPEVPLEGLEFVARGWDHEVFRAGPWAFRLPRTEAATRAFHVEQALLPWLAPLVPAEVPVPRLMAPGPSIVAVGHHFLDGLTVCEAGLGSSAQATLAAGLARFVRRLHTIPVDACPIALGPDALGRLDAQRRLPETITWLRYLEAQGALSGPTTKHLTTILEAGVPPAGSARAIVHADLHSRNVLVHADRAPAHDDGALAAVLDWVDVHEGDPALDLAAAFECFPDRRAQEVFFTTYGPVAPDVMARACWRAADHLTRALRGALAAGDHPFALASRRALVALGGRARRTKQ